jgi:hypothetical protein
MAEMKDASFFRAHMAVSWAVACHIKFPKDTVGEIFGRNTT